VIAYLPPRLDPVDIRLLTALAARVDVRIGLASFGDAGGVGDAETRRMLDRLGISAAAAPSSSFAVNARIRILRAAGSSRRSTRGRASRAPAPA